MFIFADAYEYATDNAGNLMFTLGGISLVSYLVANVAGWMA